MTLWEAHKSVIRGIMINHASRLKKESIALLEKLSERVNALELSHKRSEAANVLGELTQARIALNTHLRQKAKHDIRRCKRHYYEFGNKNSALLARALKQQQAQNFISEIVDEACQKKHTSESIAETFRHYYAGLYGLGGDTRGSKLLERIRQYLLRSNMAKITKEAAALIEAPINTGELAEAIKLTPGGKAPGPDGFTARYYKTFEPLLGPRLVRAWNTILSEENPGAFSCRELEAHITVIHKPGKDPLSCKSYRPISLLNVDMKLYAKILANRLAPLIPQLVHLDQTGFVLNREARDNVIRAINVIHAAKTSGTPLMLLSTDAEKAFDRVSWPFLRESLRYIGLGDNMRRLIEALYTTPSARVRINGRLSDPVWIKNGTRQGCPLSPLLFALSLEPFLCTVRNDPDIQGFVSRESTHKVAAYADDLLFFITNPSVSIPVLMREFETYGRLSYLKINFEKSEAMNVSLQRDLVGTLHQSFTFRWAKASLTYLGTQLPSSLFDIVSLNFLPLARKIRVDLERWDLPTFSWMGRVNIIKMSILPRLLYLFQALPTRIPVGFFTDLNRSLMSFVWNKKRARLGKRTLCRPRNQGGMSLPDFRLYWAATHLQRTCEWATCQDTKRWVQLERAAARTPPDVFMWGGGAIPVELKSHPTIAATLGVFRQYRHYSGISPLPCPMVPIITNPLLTPGLSGVGLREWGGLTQLRAGDLITESGWTPLADLRSRWGNADLDPWTLVRLQSFVAKQGLKREKCRPHTDLEKTCLGEIPNKHLTSKLYLQLVGERDSPPSFWREWEADLGTEFNEAQREKIASLAHRSSMATRVQESSYKVLTRWYYTPDRLNKISASVDPQCWRCGIERGTLMHILWSCSKIREYWEGVLAIISRLTGDPVLTDPVQILLHSTDYPISRYKKSLRAHLLNAAKMVIPRYWKQKRAPTVRDWVVEVLSISEMEDLTLAMHDRDEQYRRTWMPWLIYQESEEFKRSFRDPETQGS
ncbi:GLIPR1-like protein 2 [Gastrophryne carolinensis]